MYVGTNIERAVAMNKPRVKVVLRRADYTQEEWDALKKYFYDKKGVRHNLVFTDALMRWPFVKQVPATNTPVHTGRVAETVPKIAQSVAPYEHNDPHSSDYVSDVR